MPTTRIDEAQEDAARLTHRDRDRDDEEQCTQAPEVDDDLWRRLPAGAFNA